MTVQLIDSLTGWLRKVTVQHVWLSLPDRQTVWLTDWQVDFSKKEVKKDLPYIINIRKYDKNH